MQRALGMLVLAVIGVLVIVWAAEQITAFSEIGSKLAATKGL